VTLVYKDGGGTLSVFYLVYGISKRAYWRVIFFSEELHISSTLYDIYFAFRSYDLDLRHTRHPRAGRVRVLGAER